MKKTIIITIIALLGLSREASAQLYVGGSLTAHASFNNSRSIAVSVAPDIGYGFGNWNVGTVFNAYAYHDKEDIGSSLRISVTPYAEYYFFSAGPVSLFAEAGIGFLFTNDLVDEAPKGQLFVNPYLAPGIEISLTDHFSVMCHLGRLEWNSEANDINLTMSGESLSLGLYYSF
jgi:hypothetical protein